MDLYRWQIFDSEVSCLGHTQELHFALSLAILFWRHFGRKANDGNLSSDEHLQFHQNISQNLLGVGIPWNEEWCSPSFDFRYTLLYCRGLPFQGIHQGQRSYFVNFEHSQICSQPVFVSVPLRECQYLKLRL